jgi:hypothetical protein
MKVWHRNLNHHARSSDNLESVGEEVEERIPGGTSRCRLGSLLPEREEYRSYSLSTIGMVLDIWSVRRWQKVTFKEFANACERCI